MIQEALLLSHPGAASNMVNSCSLDTRLGAAAATARARSSADSMVRAEGGAVWTMHRVHLCNVVWNKRVEEKCGRSPRKSTNPN